MKLKILLAIILVAFVGWGVNSIVAKEDKIKVQNIKLESKASDLNKLQLDYQQLNTKLETELQLKTTNEERVKQLEVEREQLKQREAELLKQVQAKQAEKKLAAEKAQKAAVTAVNKVTGTRTVSAAVKPTGGSCDAWIAAAGITEVAAARELIRRESGCNPNAVNRSSGACGVAQELPCGKSGCSRTDGACQVAWMNKYVKGRYGSWSAAISFHNRNSWY